MDLLKTNGRGVAEGAIIRGQNRGLLPTVEGVAAATVPLYVNMPTKDVDFCLRFWLKASVVSFNS
jgi:hypothetical protein